MKFTISPSLYTLILLIAFGCNSGQKYPTADSIITGGTIYTVNKSQPSVQAIAILGDKIVFAGSKSEVENYRGENTKEINLDGRTLTPGWIESHGHFMGMGFNELNLDVSGAANYDEVVEMVREAVAKAQPGQWIYGRGWHQSKWVPAPTPMINGFQTHHQMSEVSPDNPVYLSHASGHAGFANEKAMEIAGVLQLSTESMMSEVEGGEIIRDENGNPTGIFVERATSIVSQHIEGGSEESTLKAFELAVKNSQKHGITSFHDAGVDNGTVELYKKMKNEGKMGTRLYVMLRGKDITEEWFAKGPMIDTLDNLLTVRSIKISCDGALGPRGAWLLEDYSDRPGSRGHETTPMEYVEETAHGAIENGFQLCVHAIGDRANKETLDRFEKAFNANPSKSTDHRFRIEHAQHLHPDDIPRFGQLGVIPAMQAVHMSSDRPWAIERLGEKRIVEGAYMWQSLLKTGAKVINGSDVPVEPIAPLASFYASISRKTLKGTPEGGYEPKEAMTREQALISYTIDAAYGAFEENIKGSIEVGKLADFTIFDKDIMTIPENEVLDTKVVLTILGGNIVFEDL